MPQQKKTAALRYVLITPARNEADFLEQTIQSVVAQTVAPERWVIVSDGSTDGTDEIVQKYAERFPWIELVRMPERKERHFAGKVHAFNAGRERLAAVVYDVIGSLDADITFDPDYCEFLLQKFADNPRLGVAGTPFREDARAYYRFVSSEHVSGACQLFRRACFDDIGGYQPIKTGGIDLTAVITARMKGWQTRNFTEKTSFHHRKQGSAKHGVMRGAFYDGRADYLLGCDPAWQMFRTMYRLVSAKPFVVSGALCLAGYVWAMATRMPKAIPQDVVRFRRSEERARLRKMAKHALSERFLTLSSEHR
jgi:biofilm PGA synthesis N-glycosyltransferase PgaC